jgi:hypothetical protein
VAGIQTAYQNAKSGEENEDAKASFFDRMFHCSLSLRLVGLALGKGNFFIGCSEIQRE